MRRIATGCSRAWYLLCLVVSLASCRAERTAFRFQPAPPTARQDSPSLEYPAIITSTGIHQEKEVVVKKAFIANPRHQKTDHAKLRKEMLKKAEIGFYVFKHHRLQTNVQHKEQLHPADGHIGDNLVLFLGLLWAAAVVLFIVGLASGSIGMVIGGGIVTGLFLAAYIALHISADR